MIMKNLVIVKMQVLAVLVTWIASCTASVKEEKIPVTTFQKHAAQAIQSKFTLSKGENLLKAALQKLLEDQKADVREFGKELVELYPDNPDAYFHLSFFQRIAGDYQGHVETLLRAAEIKEDPANIYNALGYIYMDMEKFDKASDALVKYRYRGINSQ